jgi:hypothetical protein
MWTPRKKSLVKKAVKERGTLLQGETLQEDGSSGAPSWGTGATSEPAVAVSAKGNSEPVERDMPLVTTRTSLLGTSSPHIPLQGAVLAHCIRRMLRHIASELGRLHLEKTKLSGCARHKNVRPLKRLRGSRGPVTYKENLADIFEENYLEDNLTEDE